MEEDFQLHQQVATRGKSAGRPALLMSLVGFLLGIGAAALLVWHGDFDRLLRHGAAANQAPAARLSPLQTTALETRLALLEDRFSRLNAQADAAAGNAARAEGMLVALAARRTIDRGEPLGNITDQLRLRFADAQPHAVDTLIAFSAKPVTLDQLDSRLDALAPQLSDVPKDVTTWARLQTELSNIFTVHRDAAPPVRPSDRIERAKLMLGSGQIAEAVDQVSRLPGAPAAAGWIDDAKRYGDAQQALDLIETTAMIDPHLLHDDQGRAVNQTSPLAQTAPSAAP